MKRLIILSLLCFMFCGITTYAAVDPTQTIRTKFIDADVNISLSGYVPRITGTISCTEGKTTTINITNLTNNTVIANDTITSDQGEVNVSYTLPSLLNPKEYAVTINCSENGVSLANISVNIDSKLVLVSVDGMLTTASNVELEVDAESTNTNLVNKSGTYTGSKELSISIPNLVASASFHLSAQGYEENRIYPIAPDVIPPTTSGSPAVSASIANNGRYFALSGCISSGAGKQITLLVTNPNQQIVYIDQVASKENGMAAIYFALPEDAINGVYQVKVGGTDVNTPAELSFNYTSGVEVDPDPNPEPEPDPNPDPDPEPNPNPVNKNHTISKASNDEFRIIIDGNNVQSFGERVFVLDYDESVITPTSFYGTRYEDTLQNGIYGSVNILSHTAGEIKFKMNNITIPQGRTWSGIMNVFKFKFISANGGITEITLSEE